MGIRRGAVGQCMRRAGANRRLVVGPAKKNAVKMFEPTSTHASDGSRNIIVGDRQASLLGVPKRHLSVLDAFYCRII